MNHIKNFSDFTVNEEMKWWQKLLVGGALSLGTLKPTDVSGQSPLSDDKPKTAWQKKTKSLRTAQNLQKQGWKLNKVETDTIWNEIQTQLPDTELITSTLFFNDNQFFESGKFELSQAAKDSIRQEISELEMQNVVITDIMIESSTDKQGLSQNLKQLLRSLGYDENNQGLSQARADALKHQLLDIGVSEDIIQMNVLFEQGTETRDQSARYVFVRFAYIIVDETVTPGEFERRPQMTKTYYLEKDKPVPPSIKTPEIIKIPKIWGRKKIKKHGKLKQRKIDLKGVRCIPF